MSPVDTSHALEHALEQVLRHPAVWRSEALAHGVQQTIATTHAELDRALPEQGWPLGALTELLTKTTGAGELSLLTPALRAICEEGRGIALLAPPYLPQARAWQQAGIPLEHMLVVEAEGRDLLWSAEQVLRSGECGAVVLWGQAAGRALNHRALQRLHLAASTGRALCFLYRPLAAQTETSPAPLRLRLEAHDHLLRVHVIKCRGTIRATPISLQLFPANWIPVNGSAERQPVHTGSPRGGAECLPRASVARSGTTLGHAEEPERLMDELHPHSKAFREVLKVVNEPSRHLVSVPVSASVSVPASLPTSVPASFPASAPTPV